MAACDRDGRLAFPVGTVAAGPAEITQLVRLVTEHAPLEVIVGLPRSLSGGEGPAAAEIRARAARLATALAAQDAPVAVRLVDERLTTVTASRRLSERGIRVKNQRSLIDAAAAATILEHALDIERSQGKPPGELLSAPKTPLQGD